MIRLIFAFIVASSALRAEPLQVVADIAPVHSLVARVMLGVGIPSLAIASGASPHGYAMRPSEARSLSQADVVVWIGPNLTPWLQGSLDTLAADAVHLKLADVAGTVLLPLRENAVFEKHDHGDHEDVLTLDPHSWLDPRNGAVWLAAIADQLSIQDPDNAATYRANALAGQAELAALETQIVQLLFGLEDRPFVVFHDAFHYFEARFGVEAAAAISLGDASAPSAARVSKVRDAVAALGAKCAFAEPQFNSGLIDTVADGQPIKIEILDPLGIVYPLGPTLYISMLTQISQNMNACLR